MPSETTKLMCNLPLVERSMTFVETKDSKEASMNNSYEVLFIDDISVQISRDVKSEMLTSIEPKIPL